MFRCFYGETGIFVLKITWLGMNCVDGNFFFLGTWGCARTRMCVFCMGKLSGIGSWNIHVGFKLFLSIVIRVTVL